jgi:alcohol dehydrogenase class IV
VAHGVACACLLAPTIRVNWEALSRRAPGSPALARYREVFRIVSPGDPTAEGAAAFLDGLRRSLGVPPLGAAGVRPADLEAVVEGSRGGSMRANPIVLTDAELASILDQALSA